MKKRVPGEYDQVFIKKFNEGRKEAFSKIFNEFYKDICYFSRQLVKNKEESEDIAITALYNLFQKCSSFNTRSNIKAFLYISARNACLNYLKRNKTEEKRLGKLVHSLNDWQDDPIYDFDEGDPLRDALQSELISKLKAMADALPARCRKIFKLHFYEDKSVTEIANELHLSKGTVSKQIGIALKKLHAWPLKLYILLLLFPS